MLNRRQLALGTIAAAVAGPAIFSRAFAQGGAPSFEIASPSDGATIDTNDILFDLRLQDFTIDSAGSGAADKDGNGQALVFVDGSTIAQLTNIYTTTSFVVPGDGLTRGKHQFAVVLASNTHVPNMDTAKMVTIDFQPVQGIPLPVANYTGDPAVTLVSPADGSTVPPRFDVQVTAEHFSPSTGLEGKTNVPGYGHYHVWVDTREMPSSLAGLVLMPGTNAFTLDLSTWGPGKHSIRIEAAQNDHTMYSPARAATFSVVVSEEATPATDGSATPAASAGGGGGTVEVRMTDALRFSPDPVTVASGQTVTWVNASSMPHSSTDDPARNPVAAQHPEFSQLPAGAQTWDSGLLDPGASFSHTFTTPGSYTYFCLPHALSGMIGHIDVTA